MRITRLVARAALPDSFTRPANLLLPTETFGDVMVTSLQGLWSQIRYPESREAFEDAVKNEIIKDTVLAQATNGSLITMALFQNLQNPLLKKYKFDPAEFVRAVGPALENFHDVLMNLGNQLPSFLAQEKEQRKSTDFLTENNGQTASDEEMAGRDEEAIIDSLSGVNIWRSQATEDPDSLANRLAKMTTEDAFDAFFYSAKLVLLGAGHRRITVQSCEVGEVALLNARALVMDQEEIQQNSKENKQGEVVEKVAAQMDVLYEVTHKYKQPIYKDPLSMQEQYKSVLGNPGEISGNDATLVDASTEKQTNGSFSKDDENDDTQYETILTTTLGVAVLEGWLSGGPDGKDLRWKVALLRDAHEFPHQPSTTRIS